MNKKCIDMIGKRFGSWEVLAKEYKLNKGKKVLYYLCRCDCGNTGLVKGIKLRKKLSSCCRKCVNKDKVDNLQGKKLWKWTILEKARSNNGVFWKCQCECGTIREINGYSLINGTRRGCKDCYAKSQRKGYCGEISEYAFYLIRSSAKCRNIVFDITHDDVWKLFLSQNRKCKLTDLDIKFSETKKGFHKNTTASLDRIDSSKGYIQENIQWIHKDLQPMKWKHNQEYFIKLCKLVTNKFKD